MCEWEESIEKLNILTLVPYYLLRHKLIKEKGIFDEVWNEKVRKVGWYENDKNIFNNFHVFPDIRL